MRRINQFFKQWWQNLRANRGGMIATILFVGLMISNIFILGPITFVELMAFCVVLTLVMYYAFPLPDWFWAVLAVLIILEAIIHPHPWLF